jgi:hypothetical protein
MIPAAFGAFVVSAVLPAQVNPSDPGVPRLADPPALERYLLESPWVPTCILLALGAVVVATFWQRGRQGVALLAAGATALLIAALQLTANLVVTQREELGAMGGRLIDAAATADTDTVGAMLAENVSITVLGAPYRSTKTDMLLTLKRDMAGRFKLREYSSSVRSWTLDGASTARTQHAVKVVPEFTGFPNSSIWMLHWRKDTQNQWRVVQIEAQQIDGVSPGSRF